MDFLTLENMLDNAFPHCWGAVPFVDTLPLLDCHAKSRIPAQAKTVFVFLFPYYVGSYPQRNISRYAIVQDYHIVAGAILQELCTSLAKRYPNEAFAPFVDNSPFREVSLGAQAGLGAVGENGLLIHKEYGSFVFIGEIASSLSYPCTTQSVTTCLQCGLCQKSCPTHALGSTGVEAQKCRSHLTQKKGELSTFEREQILLGGMVWGCDICNDVCPMNRTAKQTPLSAFLSAVEPVITVQNAPTLLQSRAFNYRGLAVILRNLEILHCDPDASGRRSFAN